MKQWTILKMIEWLTGYLNDNGVPEARLNAEHLIAHVLKVSRMELYLQFERLLLKEELALLKPLIKRRAKREPLQYILGTQPFRNVEIKVTKDVLIPRPETEIVVEKALDYIPEESTMTVLELGVGSGAISAALANERKNISITGTEISEKSAIIASENLIKHKERFRLMIGDLFKPVQGMKFEMVISNPPYCSEEEWQKLEPEVREFEPKCALLAGKDGLDFYRRIINDAHNHLVPGGKLILELGDGQSDAVKTLAEEKGGFGCVEIYKDLNGVDRVFVTTLI